MVDTQWYDDMGTLWVLLTFCKGDPLVTCGSPHKGPVKKGHGVFGAVSWTYCWTNSRVCVDLKRQDTHVTSFQCIYHQDSTNDEDAGGLWYIPKTRYVTDNLDKSQFESYVNQTNLAKRRLYDVQCYFTCTVAIVQLPSASEVILKDMGKLGLNRNPAETTKLQTVCITSYNTT